MAEDWLIDVRKYVMDADEKVVATIVRYCGIALQNRDSSLVSFSDAAETARVRENYLKKKLGLTHDDPTLDAGIATIGERMKADRTKNRVTVYYLLAEHFGTLDMFGGAKGAGLMAAGAAGAAGLAGISPAEAAPAAAVSAPPPPDASAARPAYATGEAASLNTGMSTSAMLFWLLGGIVLAGFIALVYAQSRQRPTTMPPAPAVTVSAPPVAVAPIVAAPAPAGAGVTAATRDEKPMLTVYFDTGKSDVTADFAAAAGPVKAYVEGNPAATLAVSGFNDPTGNVAANAELSKNRAKKVKAALEALGIAPARVMLEKPAETTGTGADNSQSRRVEVVVKG